MLKALKNGKTAAFIPFLMAGDSDTVELAGILIEEGADLLELGVPFSDPLADGPAIQAAAERALAAGGGLSRTLEIAKKIHSSFPKTPLVLFTYFNPIFKNGLAQFAQDAKEAGVTGVLVVDLPPEEAGEYRVQMDAHGLKTVFLASPTTDPERVPLIAEASSGFIYVVSRTGVTGVQTALSASLQSEVSRLRALTDKTLAIGFGIATPEQAREAARLGDAVVVGSAFVNRIAQASSPAGMQQEVRKLARELVGALQKDSL